MDQISIGNLFTQLFIWNFDMISRISVFQEVTKGCTKSYHSEKSLKTVYNTAATENWRLLTCQNCHMICRLYYGDKQHENISPLTLITDWLVAMHCSQKTTFHFLSVFNGSHLFYQHKTVFAGYFWKFTNSFKRCFWDVSEASQNKHLFSDIFETQDVTWKTSILRSIWEVLKTSQKRHF